MYDVENNFFSKAILIDVPVITAAGKNYLFHMNLEEEYLVYVLFSERRITHFKKYI